MIVVKNDYTWRLLEFTLLSTGYQARRTLQSDCQELSLQTKDSHLRGDD
jgi:hypothetical protein